MSMVKQNKAWISHYYLIDEIILNRRQKKGLNSNL